MAAARERGYFDPLEDTEISIAAEEGKNNRPLAPTEKIFGKKENIPSSQSLLRLISFPILVVKIH
jgi:hypothetical protein